MEFQTNPQLLDIRPLRDKYEQKARDLKARHLKMARNHIIQARKDGLPEDSTTIKYWKRMLIETADTPVEEIKEKFFKNEILQNRL